MDEFPIPSRSELRRKFNIINGIIVAYLILLGAIDVYIIYWFVHTPNLWYDHTIRGVFSISGGIALNAFSFTFACSRPSFSEFELLNLQAIEQKKIERIRQIEYNDEVLASIATIRGQSDLDYIKLAETV